MQDFGSGLVLDGSRSPTKMLGQEATCLPKEEDSGQAVGMNSIQAPAQEDAGTGPNAERQEDQRIHKRMVEFLKKRVVLLEKALNAEYHQESMEEQKGEEEIAEDVSLNDMQDAGNDTQMDLPRYQSPVLILLAPEEISAHAYDNEPRRLEVARIFNEICKMVNDCEGDAAETYTGNKAAGVRLRKSSRQMDGLCIDMRKAFVTLHPSGTPSERCIGDQSVFGASILGEDADALSEENDEDMDAELDWDCDAPPTVFPGSQKQEVCQSSSDRQQAVFQNMNSMYSPNTGSRRRTDFAAVGGVPALSTPQNNNIPRWSSSVVVLDD